jgi:hypothetical protein
MNDELYMYFKKNIDKKQQAHKYRKKRQHTVLFQIRFDFFLHNNILIAANSFLVYTYTI